MGETFTIPGTKTEISWQMATIGIAGVFFLVAMTKGSRANQEIDPRLTLRQDLQDQIASLLEAVTTILEKPKPITSANGGATSSGEPGGGGGTSGGGGTPEEPPGPLAWFQQALQRAAGGGFAPIPGGMKPGGRGGRGAGNPFNLRPHSGLGTG